MSVVSTRTPRAGVMAHSAGAIVIVVEAESPGAIAARNAPVLIEGEKALKLATDGTASTDVPVRSKPVMW